MHDERWLAIPGYPGYEVSDHGQVRSLDRDVRSKWGSTKRIRGLTLSQRLVGGSGDCGRYHACVLYREGKRRSVSVHVLVLETFIGPRPDGMVGCHWDDDPNNNHLENLRWATQSANRMDCVRNGNHPDANKTHCPQGHEYDAANTYIKPRTGDRNCRACHRDEVNRANRRKRAIAA